LVDDWQHAPDRGHIGLAVLAQALFGAIRSLSTDQIRSA
jgi:hypothetical protein